MTALANEDVEKEKKQLSFFLSISIAGMVAPSQQYTVTVKCSNIAI